MIKKLKWKSLEHERKLDNVLMMHKIVNGKVVMPSSFLPKCSRDAVKFQPVYGRVNAYTNSFIPTTVKWWNELPKEILHNDYSLFKNKISQFFN